ncbi:MAG: C25 family cysteine peptidase [Bacteroidetes bacterium]|nr:C25 family cysteine peptidase [Bacteroidota bacterium]
MRKILFSLAILLSLQVSGKNWVTLRSDNPSPAKATLVSSNIESPVVHFTLNGFYLNPVETSRGTAYTVSVKNTSPLLTKGAPDLPCITTSLIIPDKAEMEVEIVSFQYQDYPDMEIAPSKGNLTRDMDPADLPFVYGNVYQVNKYFPGDLAGTREPFIMRDFRGQTLIACPFQYNPVTKTLRVYYDITVKLKKTGNNGQNPLVKNHPDRPVTREFDNIYRHNFLNYPNSKYNVIDEEGKLLIISYGSFMTAMQPFVDWKISKGIETEMIDVATIGNSQDIKTFIENYYNENNLAYVLLVGDNAQVPTYMASSGASDNTYGYVVGNDHYIDLFVGRFSAENESQVTTQVNKSLYYEINPDTTTNWFQSCLGIASDQGPGDDGEYDYQHIRGLETILDNYHSDVFYECFDGSQGGYDAAGNPSPSQVTEAINTGASIIIYCGHGSQTSWGTSGFSNSDVNSLNNYGMLPFIWSVACVNGDFTNSTCFAESWLRASSGQLLTGAVATLMSTINQSWNSPMDAQDEMVAVLAESYTNNIKRTFGGLSMMGVAKMVENFGSDGENMGDTWNLFGDPSIVVRTAMPHPITAFHDPTVFLGVSQFQLTCPVEGALACITLNGQILGTSCISAGMATITFPQPLSTIDTLKLVITAYNYIPYIITIPIIAASGPYMAYQSAFVNDPTGNNNNLPDFGENISLDVTLRNLGVAQADGVTATLSTTDPNVIITDDSQAYGNIVANTSATQTGAYAFTVANDVADQHTVMFQLAISDNAGNNWTSQLGIKLNAPHFKITNFAIDDAAGNGNGKIDPGETMNLLITTLNNGHSDAPATLGLLSSNSNLLTINNVQYAFNTLGAGVTVDAVFNVTVSNTATNGDNIDFNYSVASGAYSAAQTFFGTVGLVDEDFETGDLTQFNWLSTGSTVPWIVTSSNPYEGQYCAMSGDINDGQNSILKVTMTVIAPDSVSFLRKVSSEQDWDYLRFYIDNTMMQEWSGELGWQKFGYPVSIGSHTFKWEYVKDDYYSSGSDAAWIDYIIFPPVSLITGTETAANPVLDNFVAYPNPAGEEFMVSYSLSTSSAVSLSLLDAVGKEVLSIQNAENQAIGIHSLSVETSSLATGLYFIRMVNKQGCSTQKLILKR